MWYGASMGYNTSSILISIRTSSHADERDEQDRGAAFGLRTEIEQLIHDNPDYARVVMDVSGP